MAATLTAEIAATAARLVVEEGMEYGPAKRRAARVLGHRSTRSAELPGNDQVEDEVREYLALFCADTQPGELAVLRAVAAIWMERLAEFRPHLTGAVWRGTATRLNDVHLELYCDDSKVQVESRYFIHASSDSFKEALSSASSTPASWP